MNPSPPYVPGYTVPRYTIDLELAVLVMDYLRGMGCIGACQELAARTGTSLEEVNPPSASWLAPRYRRPMLLR